MARGQKSEEIYGVSLVTTVHNDTYPFIDPQTEGATGLKVLITGASKGIGRATAKSFARLGASSIALLARSDLTDVAAEVAEAAKQAGRTEPQILTLSADIANATTVEMAATTIKNKMGFLDVVIDNGSRLKTWKPAADSDIDDWWRTWEVNVKGTFLVTRAMLPMLLEGKSKILLTVSSAGAVATLPGASACQGTKTAQIRANDFLMAEYGNNGLIAFAIHPVGAQTETALNMPAEYHHYMTQTPELAADTIV